MSITSMAQDSALRLGKKTPSLGDLIKAASTAAVTPPAAAQQPAQGDVDDAVARGKQAAKLEADGAEPVKSTTFLSELVKYIPTETITIYVAAQAALGEVTAPDKGQVSDADFTSRWFTLGVMLVATLALTFGLSYRAQKDANGTFTWPVFESLLACLAFLVWGLTLPSTPLRDVAGYDVGSWNSFILLVGTVVIATIAYVFGKTVSWVKVPGTGIDTAST